MWYQIILCALGVWPGKEGGREGKNSDGSDPVKRPLPSAIFRIMDVVDVSSLAQGVKTSLVKEAEYLLNLPLEEKDKGCTVA